MTGDRQTSRLGAGHCGEAQQVEVKREVVQKGQREGRLGGRDESRNR